MLSPTQRDVGFLIRSLGISELYDDICKLLRDEVIAKGTKGAVSHACEVEQTSPGQGVCLRIGVSPRARQSWAVEEGIIATADVFWVQKASRAGEVQD